MSACACGSLVWLCFGSLLCTRLWVSVWRNGTLKKKKGAVWFSVLWLCIDPAFMLTECSSLTNLQSLELRDNMLRQLPQSLSFLTKLRILDLGSNDIEELVSADRGCLWISVHVCVCVCDSVCVRERDSACVCETCVCHRVCVCVCVFVICMCLCMHVVDQPKH